MKNESPRGAATRRDLFTTVEHLLADRTDLNLSLREITTAAGVNVAAVNYHFGSKDALINTVIQNAMTVRARERIETLTALADDATVEDVIRAWFNPTLLSSDSGRLSLYERLAAHVTASTSPDVRNLFIESHQAATRLYFNLLKERLPELSPDEINFRMTLAFLAMAGLIAGVADLPVVTTGSARAHLRNRNERAYAFIMGAMTAPPPSSN